MPSICLMVRSQWIADAFLDRLVGLELVRRHLLARAPIDDQRLAPRRLAVRAASMAVLPPP